MDAATDWTPFDRPELRGSFGREGPSGCEVLIALDGMHCSACAARAERTLAGRAEEVHANVAARTLRFRFRPAQQPLSALLAALEAAGLAPRILAGDAPADRSLRQRRLGFARIGVATICAMQVMMLAWPSYFGVHPEPGIAQLLRWAQLALATPGVLWAGWPFFAGAWTALRQRALDMDVPVALALAAAFAASALRTLIGHGDLYFDTATMFVWFLLIGRQLEGRTRARAGEHLRLLAGRRALTAQRRLGDAASGRIETVAIGALAAGDLVLVAPGEALPADGRLLEQAAELDEALLSGESKPVLRVPGTTVLAGSLNLGRSALVFRAERLGADTVLAQITQLLDPARLQKPRLQQLADRLAAHFIAGVLMLALIGAAGALLRGAGHETAFGIALAVLVASCPCALSLAVPVALAVAGSRLAQAGVLLANPGALAALAKVDTVLFDKTGTLTRDSMSLQRTQPLAGLDATRCRAIAAALERGSRHPIASAFAAHDAGLAATHVEAAAGHGIHGKIEDRACWIGAPASWPMPLALPALAAAERDATQVLLCVDAAPVALFTLQASLRPEVPRLLAEFAQRGLRIELLSGDGASAVSALAAELGIAHAQARQTPADKLARLQALQAEGRCVLAVGDGLNDAPLLAAADVSAAMPKGAALTQSQADLLLLGDTLALLPQALRTARLTQARVLQNLLWALGYNLLVLPLAMTGALAPWLAALGMSLSSLVVVGNALRPMRHASAAPPAAPAALALQS